MNLVQSEIHARLRHGLTQTELAREFGIAICTLNNILKGHREPSTKVLKLLGIKREIVYVLTEDHDIPEGIAARAPLPRKRVAKQVHQAASQPASPQASTEVWHPRMREKGSEPKLTTECVLIAVKFGLNPRDTWAAFLETNYPLYAETIDQDWLSYCESRGKQIETKPADVMYAGLGNGDAIALKAVAPRQDFRRPKQLGELPTLQPIDQPEVAI